MCNENLFIALPLLLKNKTFQSDSHIFELLDISNVILLLKIYMYNSEKKNL